MTNLANSNPVIRTIIDIVDPENNFANPVTEKYPELHTNIAADNANK